LGQEYKPLPDLDKGYDPDWWVKKLVAREKVSVLPPALELLRRVELEMARLWTSRDEAEVRRRVTALNGEISRRRGAGGATRPSAP
jgi:hypothetical protein